MSMICNTIKIIDNLKPILIEKVSIELSKFKDDNIDVSIAWKRMQDVSSHIIIQILQEYLIDSEISKPTSKSTYPDIKIKNNEGLFAIDIKVNEDSKNPWFDMARMDTLIEERFDKYNEEWEFVIRFDSNDGKFIKSYFSKFIEIVGIRNECSGIKYRPYDGKVRPKTWEDFDNDIIYWKTKEEFLNGLNRSKKNRWKNNIIDHLIPSLTDLEKDEFKKLFDKEIVI